MQWNDAVPTTALEILGVVSRETSITRLLAAAIAAEPAFGRCLLTQIGAEPVPGNARLTVHTELTSPAGNRRPRPDLVAAWVDNGRARLYLLENKLYAHEGEDQTAEYAAAVPQLQALLAPDPDLQWHPPVLRLLSLFGEEPHAPEFRALRSEQIMPVLCDAPGNSAAALLAREWGELLRRFYAWPQRWWNRPLDDAIAAQSASALDPMFLLFEQISRKVAQAAGLTGGTPYRSAAQGREWYGCHLRHPDWWYPSGWRDRRDKPFVAERDYWTHLQLRMIWPVNNPHAKRLELALFHETLPYRRQKDFCLEEHSELAVYRTRRTALSKQLAEILADSDWRVAGHWCQIAQFTPGFASSLSPAELASAITKAADGLCRRIADLQAQPA